MRALLLGIATLLIAGIGCGGDSGDGPGPTQSVLTTVEVTPATATLFTVAPGNTVMLTVVPKDQDGQVVADAGAASFSSDNDAIATVSDNGVITAVGAGTAHITVSLTADGVTKAGTSAVTVQAAPANAAVVTPTLAFQPGTVDVQAGGTVNWTFGSTPHTVTFTTGGAPADVPQLENGSASRAFPTSGSFSYHCTIHPQMVGAVRVH
jgi:plastocyanin